MKLEVGKYYKTRDGRKVGPIMWRAQFDELDEPYVFQIEDGTHYSRTGENGSALSYIEEDDGDLIDEWSETPTVGTLAEIWAQVGDVVECTANKWQGTIFRIVGARYFAREITNIELASDPVWRIASRASDYQPSESECIEAAMAKGIDYPAQQSGPVITETVKRVVPGVYGKVDVGFDDGEWCIDLTHSLHGRAELIAARATLSQLIDAMADE